VRPYVGSLDYRLVDGTSVDLALIQQLIHNQGDGWAWMQEELGRYYERVMMVPEGRALATAPDPWAETDERGLPPELDELLGISDDAAAALGSRTAELHCALGTPVDDPAFAPEPMTPDDFRALLERIRSEAVATFELLRQALATLPDERVEAASFALSRRGRVIDLTSRIEPTSAGTVIRIHGDYHLGNVLRTGQTFAIVDFDGRPDGVGEERRLKESPLKDVAAMLRSFAYAANIGLAAYAARHPHRADRLAPAARVWEQSVSSVFLREYRRGISRAPILPPSHDEFIRLLRVYLIERALAELRHELTNRPEWVNVPLAGILALTQ
jgi:maltose alpha-D-glucosyltransferase/alpha-amylase